MKNEKTYLIEVVKEEFFLLNKCRKMKFGEFKACVANSRPVRADEQIKPERFDLYKDKEVEIQKFNDLLTEMID